MNLKKVSEKKADIIALVKSRDFAESPVIIQEQVLNMHLEELLDMHSPHKSAKMQEAENNRKQTRFYVRCWLVAITILLLIILLIISLFFYPEPVIFNLIISAISTIVGFSFGRSSIEKNEEKET
ncbi:MAG: hypothetical protein K2O36_02530 [Ruminococcus sp.]|nr:hypothetical protein [Ruminococcus sp.]